MFKALLEFLKFKPYAEVKPAEAVVEKQPEPAPAPEPVPEPAPAPAPVAKVQKPRVKNTKPAPAVIKGTAKGGRKKK